MLEFSTLQKLAYLAFPVVLAITLHEAAHGWVADRLGDGTARRLGRISLNPLRHIDWIGTVALPIGLFVTTGFMFGWAKPVPVDPRGFRHPRRDMALVAVAGPGANLLMAVAWAAAIVIGQSLLDQLHWLAATLIFLGAAGVAFNIFLMLLNLLPILPLDGGRLLASVLPERIAALYGRLEPVGLFILIGLLITGMLGNVLVPMFLQIVDWLPGTRAVLNVFPRLIS